MKHLGVFNNREWAALLWVAAFLVFLLVRKDTRASLLAFARIEIPVKVLIPFGMMVGYVALLSLAGWRLGIWGEDLIKGTILWFVTSAIVLFFKSVDASKERHFFRRKAFRTLETTVFLAFFLNLFVLSLPSELLLQPVVLVLTALPIVAGRHERFKRVKTIAELILGGLVLSLGTYALVNLILSWDSLNPGELLTDFALPVWMTIGLLPFIYLLSLLAGYGSAFKRVEFMLKGDRISSQRVKLALITSIWGRVSGFVGFGGHWVTEAAATGSIHGAKAVIRKFLAARRIEELETELKELKLLRYAGVDGVDEFGRQLDRREFEETKRALQWLASCHMGWYRNERKYQTHLLETVMQASSNELPEEHGVTMRVAEDGQAWWAWRRTITGWCFAIGSAGPPPDQWEFDGPEPPTGYPGRDQAWGESPLSMDSRKNW